MGPSSTLKWDENMYELVPLDSTEKDEIKDYVSTRADPRIHKYRFIE